MLKDTARRLRIGPHLLSLRHHALLGVRGALELRSARKSVLPQIRNAAPARRPSDTALEVHMLLGHSRVLEGLWSLLSLDKFAVDPVAPVIHSDGSLTSADLETISEKLPGSRHVSRGEADEVVGVELSERGLKRCAEFRGTFILARKIFDPPMFARGPTYVVLDSDVLFFGNPVDLVKRETAVTGANGPSRYSVDNGFRYSLSAAEMKAMIGVDPVSALNSGVMRLNTADLGFARIEKYLDHPGFRDENGKHDYYAEMTLFALELSLARALPLSAAYEIAPPIPFTGGLVAGHYCGGIKSAHMYYTRALPSLQTSVIGHRNSGLPPGKQKRHE